jgi:twitching motility two-component system response regulator PilH
MKRNILVVDDSPTDRVNLESILRAAGHKVRTAKSGTEAMEKVGEEVPDAIFLDVIMPEMDGYRTCRQLRKNEATKDVPIFFVTSKKEEADKMWAMRQGCNGYLVKPAVEHDVLAQLLSV